MPRKTKEEAAATRDALLNAAVTLFLRKGVSRTTLDEIAREAGVTRGAVYHHFENKSALVKELLESVRLPVDELIAQLGQNVGNDPLGALQDWTTHMFSLLLGDPWRRRVDKVVYHRCEFVEEMNPIFQVQCERSLLCHEGITRIFQRAREMGQLRPDIQPRHAAFALYSFGMGLHSNLLKEPWEGRIELPYKELLDVFFRGLRTTHAA